MNMLSQNDSVEAPRQFQLALSTPGKMEPASSVNDVGIEPIPAEVTSVEDTTYKISDRESFDAYKFAQHLQQDNQNMRKQMARFMQKFNENEAAHDRKLGKIEMLIQSNVEVLSQRIQLSSLAPFEARLNGFQKILEHIKVDITSYEQVIKRKVYAEHNFEYAEQKRHADKIKKLQDDIREIKKNHREQNSMANAFRVNEKKLLRQIHVLEQYLLERMGSKGPFPFHDDLQGTVPDQVKHSSPSKARAQWSTQRGKAEPQGQHSIGSHAPTHQILNQNQTSINNHFNVVFNNTEPEVQSIVLTEKVAFLENELREITNRFDAADIDNYKEYVEKRVERAQLEQRLLYDTFKEQQEAMQAEIRRQEAAYQNVQGKSEEVDGRITAKVSEMVKESESGQKKEVERMLEQHAEEMRAQRARHDEEINIFIREYFQEWLDINAIQQFNSMINRRTTLKDDWFVLSEISYQLKFYGVETVRLMTNNLEKKWVRCVLLKNGELNNALTDDFKRFKHTHPMIL